MKIIAEKNDLVITEAYSGVLLRTEDGEELGICMRDSGFEFTYQGKNYSAQRGILKPMVCSCKSTKKLTNGCSNN